ncbi:MAG: CRISPR-associated endoribonuclease Cas2 [Pseudomonadota bacterium]|uniref:CRISPR-associated endonuclease Cas2 n=1 Tax=Malikia spinosa TaxID=86180 RepID=UPI00323E8ADF
MWMVVMFDLPVVSHEERKAATDFRNDLLDMGFEMAQFSVYMRFCTSPAQLETYANRVAACLPDGGRVSILQFTDKQYERILNFKGRKRQPTPKPPDQFDLF